MPFSFRCIFDRVRKIFHHLKYTFFWKLERWTFKQTRKIGHMIPDGHLSPYMATSKNHALWSLTHELIIRSPPNLACRLIRCLLTNCCSRFCKLYPEVEIIHWSVFKEINFCSRFCKFYPKLEIFIDLSLRRLVKDHYTFVK